MTKDIVEPDIPDVPMWYINNMLPLEVKRGLVILIKTLMNHNGWEVKGAFDNIAEEEGTECHDGAYRSRLFSLILVKTDSDMRCELNQNSAWPVLEIMVMNTFQINLSLSMSWGRKQRPNTWMKIDFNTFNREVVTQDDQVEALAWVIESTGEMKEMNSYD